MSGALEIDYGIKPLRTDELRKTKAKFSLFYLYQRCRTVRLKDCNCTIVLFSTVSVDK
jgi:hypothetical protein